MPELTPEVLIRHLRDLLFLGLDKSATELLNNMKEDWDSQGRPGTHFWQGFREIRWESVQLAIESGRDDSFNGRKTASDSIKEIMSRLVMRDGFKISTGISYVVEDWNNTRFALGDIRAKAEELRDTLSDTQRDRLCDRDITITADWIKNPNYSPDRAEEFRPKMD